MEIVSHIQIRIQVETNKGTYVKKYDSAEDAVVALNKVSAARNTEETIDAIECGGDED